MANTLNYSRLFNSKVVNDAAEDDIFTLDSGVLRNLVIIVSNITTGTGTISGWVIPSGGTSGNDNQFLTDYSLGANAFEEIPVPKMVKGDKLTLQASAADTFTVFDGDSVVRLA